MAEMGLRALVQSMLGVTAQEDGLLINELARRFVLSGMTISSSGVLSITIPILNISLLTGTANKLAAFDGSGNGISTLLVNAHVDPAAAIAYSKLNLALSILNGDINAAAAIDWTKISKTGSSLADLLTRSASDLSSGTLPDARFPATLPVASGVNLTALNASNLASGTVAAARLTLAALLASANVFASSENTTPAGGSSETMKAYGIIDTDSTQQGTGANTTDTALRTYTLPANAFNANNRVIKVTAWGSFAANGNTKTVRIKWNGLAGTTVVATTLSVNNQNWILVAHIVRTGASTQDTLGYALVSSPSQDLVATFGTAAATDTGAIDIVISAQNGTASANDIRYEGSIIELGN